MDPWSETLGVSSWLDDSGVSPAALCHLPTGTAELPLLVPAQSAATKPLSFLRDGVSLGPFPLWASLILLLDDQVTHPWSSDHFQPHPQWTPSSELLRDFGHFYAAATAELADAVREDTGLFVKGSLKATYLPPVKPLLTVTWHSSSEVSHEWLWQYCYPQHVMGRPATMGGNPPDISRVHSWYCRPWHTSSHLNLEHRHPLPARLIWWFQGLVRWRVTWSPQ